MMKPFKDSILLEDGNRVGVVGGGPAGSLFSYFLLLLAKRFGRDIQLDIYETRTFEQPGSAGCNMCGGIISESLVQSLAVEGINLPDTVVQRGIESYVLHTEYGTRRLETPVGEKRIAAVHRGGGPRTVRKLKWQSFDAHLLNLAIAEGANHHADRVTGLGWYGDKPQVQVKGEPSQTYDLLVGAVGMNSPALALFEQMGFNYQRPKPTKTYITELAFGSDSIGELFGNSMHVFLLSIPRLDFAALIPKGDYLTTCLLGENIDKELIASFFEHPAVRECFPANWELPADGCHCAPKMFFGDARNPYTDRVVLIGDAGISRLYKDGIGGAYRTAKAAARTAIFQGISSADFRADYMTECRRISWDNQFGRLVFLVVHGIKKLGFPASAVLKTIQAESVLPGKRRRMSMVLWDTFTGSAPYRDIFFRTLHPLFLGPFMLRNVWAALLFWRKTNKSSGAKARKVSHAPSIPQEK